MSDNKASVQLKFEGSQIRRILDEETNEWWYAVVDVIEALTDSQKPRDYWYRMKKRVAENEGVELSTICRQFKLKAANNRFYNTDCANTEGMFRIIQSIPQKSKLDANRLKQDLLVRYHKPWFKFLNGLDHSRIKL